MAQSTITYSILLVATAREQRLPGAGARSPDAAPTVGRMPTVLLVRHGRSTANGSGVLAGWTSGVGLDERGRAQVAALADRLAQVPVAAVVCSPLQRCQETVRPLLERRPQLPWYTD